MATKKQVTENWAVRLRSLVECGAIPTAVHRVLLYGPYGTGKSSAAAHIWGENRVERVQVTTATTPDDLLGCVALSADGRGGTLTAWCDGPATRAMRAGKVLVLDEIDQASADLLATLHGLLDDRSIAGVRLTSGEWVRPHADFCVVATSNAAPDDLMPGVRNRMELILLADDPAPGIQSSLPRGMAAVLGREYAGRSSYTWATPEITVRTVLSVHRLSEVLGSVESAAKLVFGEAAGQQFAEACALQESAAANA